MGNRESWRASPKVSGRDRTDPVPVRPGPVRPELEHRAPEVPVPVHLGRPARRSSVVHHGRRPVRPGRGPAAPIAVRPVRTAARIVPPGTTPRAAPVLPAVRVGTRVTGRKPVTGSPRA